ncbi:AAA family ATPase [Flavitalea flava]
MDVLIGRTAEQKMLEEALHSTEAELIAVYGRRRVGKTFLIRKVFEEHFAFEFTGIHGLELSEQLQNFSLALKTAMNSPVNVAIPSNWLEAFHSLQSYLTHLLTVKKQVIFFDEFPWIHTPKSGFLGAFGHFWNTWASKQDNLVVIVCGSAASWMIRNIVNNKGGLHNRITQKIRLLPFNLYEVEAYLQSRHISLERYQLLQIYMSLGGIPQYLKSIQPGESPAQSIDRLCFSKDGKLKEEFGNLYQSLFDHASNHINIVKALAEKGQGLTRTEIMEVCGFSTGGTTTKWLEELIESGFITTFIPFEKKEKDAIYKLTDEYSLFYLKFMEKNRSNKPDTWLRLTETASWKSWSGLAFERICLKHISQIQKTLGIQGVLTEESIWRYSPQKNESGAQIDLLIDRQDQCINVCEIKFTLSDFTIDKMYASELQRKLAVFKEKTKTRKTLFLTLITTHGAKKNPYYLGLVQKEITMHDLFSDTNYR